MQGVSLRYKEDRDSFRVIILCLTHLLLLSLSSEIKVLEEATKHLVEAAEVNLNYVKQSRPLLFRILQQVRCKDIILYELLLTEGMTRDNANQFLGAIDEGITELRQIELAVDQALSTNEKEKHHGKHGHSQRHGHGHQPRHPHQNHYHQQLHLKEENQQGQQNEQDIHLDPRLQETKQKAKSPPPLSPVKVSAARSSVNLKKEIRRLDSILPSMTSSKAVDVEDDDEGVSMPLSLKYLRKNAAGDSGGAEEMKKRTAALRHMREVIGGKGFQ